MGPRRLIAAGVLLSALAVMAPVFGSQGAPRNVPSAIDEEATCPAEYVPQDFSVAGVLDDGRDILLNVHILLDGVTRQRGAEVVAQMQQAYAPLKITLVPTYQEVDIPYQRMALEFPLDEDEVPTSDSQYLFEQSKAAVGGRRPLNTDVVYLLTSDRITGGTAGVANCVGGVKDPAFAFAIGEEEPDDPHNGLAFCCTWATAKIAAHEIAHLLGAHHHYANCAEGAPTAIQDQHMLTCTMMFNDVGGVNLHFSALEGATVRGHAVAYADRPLETEEPDEPTDEPGTEPSDPPSEEPDPEPEPQEPEEPAEPESFSYHRTVSVKLRGHLVVSGAVDAGDATGCSDTVDVYVERQVAGEWVAVGVAESDEDGSFRLKLDDEVGRYRASVEETVGYDGDEEYTCVPAASPARRHSHR